MPAAELTDISSVRQFMQKSLGDRLQDEDLSILIIQASETISRHLNRELLPRTDNTLRSFEFLPVNNGLDVVDLRPYEFRVCHEVTVDPDIKGTVLNAVNWRPWPYPSRDGTFFGLRLAELPMVPSIPEFGSRLLPYQTRRLDVLADWGMGSVPAELQHWVNLTVEEWAKLRRGAVAGGQGGEFGEGPLPTDLPPAVRMGLRRWTRGTPEV